MTKHLLATYVYTEPSSTLPVTTPISMTTSIPWFSSVAMIGSASAAAVLILLAIIASTAIFIAVHRRKQVTTEHIYEVVEGPRFVMTTLAPHGAEAPEALTQSSELPDVISRNTAYSLHTIADGRPTYTNVIPDVRTLDSALVFASGAPGSTLPCT